jgi:hypothetical protein
MQANLTNFFLAARVVRTTYRVATTAILMYYIMNRVMKQKPLVYEDQTQNQRRRPY